MRIHALTGSLLIGLGLALGAPSASAQIVQVPYFLDVYVPAVQADGAFRLDGVPTPPATSEVGELGLDGLFGPETGTPVGTTPDQGWGPSWWIPGTYQPTYGFDASASGALPRNRRTPIGPPVEVDGLGPVDFDIPSVEVTLTLTLGGASFPAPPADLAVISLRNTETGDVFPAAASQPGPITFAVLPGRYDFLYSYAGGSLLPVNSNAVVLAGADLTVDRALVVDIPVLAHSVTATLNGTPFPSSPYERGEIWLEDPDSQDRIAWGSTAAPAGVQRIIPGTYDVVYAHVTGNLIVPANRWAVVAEDVVIEPPPLPNQLSFTTVDVTSHPVDVVANLDGAPFPASAYERGELVMRGARGDEVPLGQTHVPVDTVQVVPGRFDVHYRYIAGSSLVPQNRDARILQSVRIDEPETLAIDVQTVELELEFRLDGALFPASAYERGDLSLQGALPGDTIPLGSTSEQQTTLRVVPGHYDVYYDYVTGSSIVPHNAHQRAETDLAFLADQAQVLDVATRVVAPSFALNRAPFPTTVTDRGEIVLRGPGGGELSLGETHVPVPPSVIAIEDDYAIAYRWVEGDDVPRNAFRIVDYLALPEPGIGVALALGAGALAWAGKGRRRSAVGRPEAAV